MNSLEGKKALVTGGTAGIGREIALEFAKAGASVHIFGRSETRAKKVVEELNLAGASGHGYTLVDISDSTSLENTFVECVKTLGGVDILVNNAGITRDNLLMRISSDDWDAVLDTNLKSVYVTCKSVVRPMMKQRSGKIINITSVVGISGNPGQTNYAASKAGLIGFSKSLAREVASRGITVNCIAPGFTETSMTGALNDVQKEAILNAIPMKRMGQPSDIAQAALYLACAEYTTGQTLTVDGGMVMQ